MLHGNKLLPISAAVLLATSAPLLHAAVSDDEIKALQDRLANIEQQDKALKTRVAELEAKETADWLTTERAAQIRSVVEQVIADAKLHDQSPDDVSVGYKNGFYIQTADQNFKLAIGGVLQVRYEYASHHAKDSNFGSKPPLAQGNNENSSGFDIRRARINFTGNAFSKDLFYRFEGDFYGNGSGGFTVTDAYVGYAFSDAFRIRAGSFKTPFTKAELEYDANLQLERAEVNFPFDAQRSIGMSLFGDIIHDKLSYEVNANDGSKSNTFRFVDTNNSATTVSSSSSSSNTPSFNLDNRLAFYGRLQYAGSGKISEFYDGGEADLRQDNQQFIWMAGGAVGYESQNSAGAAFTQNSLTVPGLGSNNSPGFMKAYALNGDIFRATLDWSAKWRGLSINTAAYFQEVNANPFSGTVNGGLPYATGKSAFFQSGYYAQVGYMIIPQRLEALGRVSYLLDEGDPNMGQFYTVGLNYYLFGSNARVTADVTYTPEAAYTDAASLELANTREVVFRLQLQLKF